MTSFVSYIEYYLPVFIPLLLTVISVLAGILMKRIDLSLHSILKIHSDIVIGLFSFVIWALVTYQQTGAIALNKDYELGLIRVVLLLFANIILLVAGQVVMNIKWSEFSLGHIRRHARFYDNAAHALVLGVTLLVVFAPISLASAIEEPEPSPRTFRVAIPYFDPSLANRLGPVGWQNRLLCQIESVAATDREVAIQAALEEFKVSDRSLQFYQEEGTRDRVRIEEQEVVASGE